MKMKRFIKSLILFSPFFLICCNNINESDKNLKTTFFVTGEKECEFQVNKLGEKEGVSVCYYENGNEKVITQWRKDTIPINEQFIYYPNGILKEYNFFNYIGEKRYTRVYSENGDLVNEMGDFLSHEILSSQKINLGDSVVIDIYIASPPDCKFEVYGIDGDGRYSLKNKSEINYICKLIIEPSSKGNYVFVYEIDFIDNLNNKFESRKSEVSFIVE